MGPVPATGCRKSEIVTLKWSFYREGQLFLLDSKTGPRTVWLSSASRKILDSLPRESAWVFPSPRTGSCLHPVTVCNIRKIQAPHHWPPWSYVP